MLATIDNRAAELGPSTVPWWKDWRGQPSAIIASGASVKAEEVQKLRGRVRVIALKENAYDPKIAPWADVAYGCDLAWWKHRRGLETFKGTKIGHDPRIRGAFPDVNLITIPKTKEKGQDRYGVDLLLNDPGVIGGGCNSGFQAFNLDVQFGSNRILLVGFDMRGQHWYGRNQWHGSHNAGETDMKRWCGHFNKAAEVVRRLGIDVVNGSPISALTCFRKASIDETLKAWGV